MRATTISDSWTRTVLVQHESPGDCYDNAVMEAFFSTVRLELADRFASCDDARRQLFDYIELFVTSVGGIRQSGKSTPLFV